MQREGVFREMKRRRFYEKPSEQTTREKAEAIRRARKLARKKAQRGGFIALTRNADRPATKPSGSSCAASPGAKTMMTDKRAEASERGLRIITSGQFRPTTIDPFDRAGSKVHDGLRCRDQRQGHRRIP